MRSTVTMAALAITLLAHGAKADGESTQDLDALAEAARAMAATITEMPTSARLPSDALLATSLARLSDRVRLAEFARTRDGDRRRQAGRDSLEADQERMEALWYNVNDRPQALETRARASLSAERFESVAQRVKDFEKLDLARSIGIYQRRLDRYETKFGPGSPKLNLVEVMLNGFLQDTWPLKSNALGPSPNEWLLGYTTSYAVMVDHEAKPLSVLEAGLRRYRLDWSEHGSGDWSGLLQPRYWSLGVAVAADQEGALRWPLEHAKHREMDYGPFLTWGDLKAAYFFGKQNRIAISRQFQLLPGLF